MAVRRKQIRELVERLLLENNVKPGKVPVEKIARRYGVTVILDEVDQELSGFLYRDTRTNKAVIGANKSHHENRRRFTIAHELAHFFLHEGERVHLDSGKPTGFVINLRGPHSARGENNDEREANLFAAELLMPAKFLERDLNDKDLDLLQDDDLIRKLARKYKFSVQALTFRLANLGYAKGG